MAAARKCSNERPCWDISGLVIGRMGQGGGKVEGWATRIVKIYTTHTHTLTHSDLFLFLCVLAHYTPTHVHTYPYKLMYIQSPLYQKRPPPSPHYFYIDMFLTHFPLFDIFNVPFSNLPSQLRGYFVFPLGHKNDMCSLINICIYIYSFISLFDIFYRVFFQNFPELFLGTCQN